MPESRPLADFPYPALAPELNALAAQDKTRSIQELLEIEPRRSEHFSCRAAGWRLDYSRQLLGSASRDALLRLARDSGVLEAREGLFDGRPINHTEQRAVLHSLLRAQAPEPGLEAEYREVQDCLERMAAWVDRVHSGEHRGFSGDSISDVVNLGIGGSDLGPRMVVDALRPYHSGHCRTHFVANIDPDDLSATLAGLDAARTLFIVCSKTLRTEETLHNAQAARRWLLEAGVDESALGQHFLAVSTNLEAARELGIPAGNILPMWDWVGGRYSLWSAIGWSIAFAVGMARFRELLAGAASMDRHFREADPENNMPLWLSLLEVWYVNFMAAQSHAVIPYHQDLVKLPAFLQQLSMESNGKSVNFRGEKLNYATAPILWGDVGTNGQHSFHQLLHQGTVLCPIDFVLVTGLQEAAAKEGRRRLLANGLAQSRALLVGRDEATCAQSLEDRGVDPERAVKLAPHLVIAGNRPSSTLSTETLTPAALGALLALYEHKTFCSAQIWQINAFDQWGVELGKVLSKDTYSALSGNREDTDKLDRSTRALVDLISNSR
jgi:glucose-6-phosphate isomerase